MQHFIAGEPVNCTEAEIEGILFETILSEQDENEIVVFAVSERWYDFLDNIFEKRGGLTDVRKIFSFNHDSYRNVIRKEIPGNIVPVVELKKCIPYSRTYTWSVRLTVGGNEVSYCNAVMVGKGNAEIDIATDERYQNKGYATLAATLLIDKLIESGLTPSWSTWPFRVESQQIAQKLGFTAEPDAKAWIWMEDI